MTESIAIVSSHALDLSAASGLVVHGDVLVVVADDEVALARFDRTGRRIDSLAVGMRALPEDERDRKRAKPDFEAIAVLDERRVVVLGSGSTRARHRGCVVDVTNGEVRDVDLRPLHDVLSATFPELNLEGAAFVGDTFVLAQRGNGASRSNALVVLDAPAVRAAFHAGRLDAAGVRAIVPLELGSRDSVPLSITDLAVDPRGRLWFAAAAEDTTDTYADGVCRGSIVGRLDDDHRIALRFEVPGEAKIEGLCFDPADSSGASGFLVDDPDDRAKHARLLWFSST